MAFVGVSGELWGFVRAGGAGDWINSSSGLLRGWGSSVGVRS